VVVHGRPGGPARAGDRDAGDDRAVDPRSSFFAQMRHETLPPTTSSAGGWRC
jgi:hypothetical protein